VAALLLRGVRDHLDRKDSARQGNGQAEIAVAEESPCRPT
jgi:hypothetical protein